MAEEKKLPPQTIINAGTVIGSAYAHLVNVSVSDMDITLEFAFINPRDPATGQIVSRVTLPKPVGLELADLILAINLAREKEQKKGGTKKYD